MRQAAKVRALENNSPTLRKGTKAGWNRSRRGGATTVTCRPDLARTGGRWRQNQHTGNLRSLSQRPRELTVYLIDELWPRSSPVAPWSCAGPPPARLAASGASYDGSATGKGGPRNVALALNAKITRMILRFINEARRLIVLRGDYAELLWMKENRSS